MPNENEFTSDDQRDAYIAGLRVELERNRAYGYVDAIADVEAELARLGVVDQAAAEKRPARPRRETRA